jgi:hypothetical protein
MNIISLVIGLGTIEPASDLVTAEIWEVSVSEQELKAC